MLNTPVIGTADAQQLLAKCPLFSNSTSQSGVYKPTSSSDNFEIYPVLFWGGNIIWPLAYQDNRYSIALFSTTSDFAFLAAIEIQGTRYIDHINIDQNAQTATFVGEHGSPQSISWRAMVPPPAILNDGPAAGKQLPNINGLKLSPNNTPCLSVGNYTYWPLSFLDNRMAICVVAIDINGTIADARQVNGVRYISSINFDSSQGLVAFTGQSEITKTLTIDTFWMVYTCCFQLAAQDFLDMADLFNVPITLEQAQQMAATWPNATPDSCNNCDTQMKRKRDWLGATMGAVLGTVIGGAVGFIFADGPGLATGATIGAALLMEIGENFDVVSHEKPPPPTPSPQDLEYTSSFVFYENFPTGPYDNTHIGEDMMNPLFSAMKGYNSGLNAAAALAKADPSDPLRIRGYYPSLKQVTNNLDHANCDSIPGNPDWDQFSDDPSSNNEVNWSKVTYPVWTFMFVIIKVPNIVDARGRSAFQLRFHPETWLVGLGDRPPHSALTDGYRIVALLGYPSMQCWAAGKFHVDGNGRIFRMDTQTGHYFRGFLGKDEDVINSWKGFMTNMGYDVSRVVCNIASINKAFGS